MTEDHDEPGDGHDEPGDNHEETEYEEPERTTFCHDPVGHSHVWAGMSVDDLADQYGHAGIGAASVHEAVDIYTEMLADDDCTVFMSLAGAMVPAGMRRIVSELIRDGHVDVLVTTGANLTHDSINSIGGLYLRLNTEHRPLFDLHPSNDCLSCLAIRIDKLYFISALEFREIGRTTIWRTGVCMHSTCVDTERS